MGFHVKQSRLKRVITTFEVNHPVYVGQDDLVCTRIPVTLQRLLPAVIDIYARLEQYDAYNSETNPQPKISEETSRMFLDAYLPCEGVASIPFIQRSTPLESPVEGLIFFNKPNSDLTVNIRGTTGSTPVQLQLDLYQYDSNLNVEGIETLFGENVTGNTNTTVVYSTSGDLGIRYLSLEMTYFGNCGNYKVVSFE